MSHIHTTVTKRILTELTAQSNHAAFLAVLENGPLLTFGGNRTQHVTYQILLYADSGPIIQLNNDDGQKFVLLLSNVGPNRDLELVIYLEENEHPALEISSESSRNHSIRGLIQICAFEPKGTGQAMLQAVISDSRHTSFLIEGSPEGIHHLRTLGALILEERSIDHGKKS